MTARSHTRTSGAALSGGCERTAGSLVGWRHSRAAIFWRRFWNSSGNVGGLFGFGLFVRLAWVLFRRDHWMGFRHALAFTAPAVDVNGGLDRQPCSMVLAARLRLAAAVKGIPIRPAESSPSRPSTADI